MTDKQVVTPDVGTEPTQNKPDPEPKQEKKLLTQAEFDNALKERLAREKSKHADYDALKAKAAKLDEIEAANLSELEKLQKQNTELAQKAEQAEASRLAAERRATIVSEATKLGFADPADAVVMVGEAENIEEALGELAEKKPYLLKQPDKQPKPKLNPTNPGPVDETETRAQKRARIFGGLGQGSMVFDATRAAQHGGGVSYSPGKSGSAGGDE